MEREESASERERWGNKVDFILSCIGYAVGLGNVWRFPYLCGRNGGASFMIPYFIFIIFAGFPVFYMELAIGQFSRISPGILYDKMCPVFGGIGPAMVIMSAYTALYYNMILGWALHYFGASMQKPLPWEQCNHPEWNDDFCLNGFENKSCEVEENGVYWQRKCGNESDFPFFSNGSGSCYTYDNVTFALSRGVVCGNNTYDSFKAVVRAAYKDLGESPSEQYLNNRVYKLSSGIHEMGMPRWELVLALMGAWILVFLCQINGIKTAGKVVYFTATFPYFLLLVLLIRGVTLPGAIEGIKFFVVPNMSKLTESQVWGDAAVQVFFSLSVGGGGLTTLATYNDFDNDILRDTFIVLIGDCFTSIFAGFALFPVLGFIAQRQNRPVAEVAKSGVGLAFIAYPEALAKIPWAQLWSVLFFFMLVLLGIDTEIVMVDVVMTAIVDLNPMLRRWPFKVIVLAGICTAGFIIGLFLTCPGGPYVLTIIDNYAAGWPLVIACLIEVCMVSYVYGIRRFMADIHMMLGKPGKIEAWITNRFLFISWVAITPLLLTGVLLFSWASFEPSEYGKYVYPVWADILGWMMAFSSIVFIFIIGGYRIIECIIRQWDWKSLITPRDDWKDSLATPEERPSLPSKTKKVRTAYSLSLDPNYVHPRPPSKPIRPSTRSESGSTGSDKSPLPVSETTKESTSENTSSGKGRQEQKSETEKKEQRSETRKKKQKSETGKQKQQSETGRKEQKSESETKSK